MTDVRIVHHTPRLAQLLEQPGGITLAEAVARAEANLETIRPTCRADLMTQLESCEALVARVGGAFEESLRAELYAVAVRCIGVGGICGVQGVDEALGSFCDLLEHNRVSGRFDREAIAVHVGAWRLLMSAELPPEARESVLAGLRKVAAKAAA